MFLHTIPQGKILKLIQSMIIILILYVLLFRQESSLHTPFEVMFGRKAVLPVDINENVPCTPNNNDDINKAVEILTDNRMHVLQEVCLNFTSYALCINYYV